MEEILASIRRIIADDDATKTPPRAAEPPKVEPPPPVQRQAVAPPEPEPVEEPEPLASTAVEEQSSDIFDLTESMRAPMPEPSPAPQFRTIDGSSDVDFDETPSPPRKPNGEERGRLVSKETSAAVDSAFNALAQTVLVQNARTLEDLVREMLRPMLKTWLDDNLPGMVERLVRAEIERVSRGRTG
jgi:uncharacterized protein